MPRRKRPLRRPDLRLVERGLFPMLDYLLQPMSRHGRVWLEAHAEGRQWVDGALAIEAGIYAEGSLVAQASGAGLGVTGWGPVHGAMLWHVRAHCPELSMKQLAARLGFTVREWRLMEADERMVPDPDDFWDRAMELVDEIQEQRERWADAAESN